MTVLEQAIKDSEEREKPATAAPWNLICDYAQFKENKEFISHARTWEPRFREMVKLLMGRIRGHGESTLYESESKWAAEVLEEVEQIAKGEK